VLQGNVENFTGAAQVPLGISGPLLVNGEHAEGEFYVPLATAEGRARPGPRRAYGSGKVNKLAEIVAATVLCGELSLGSAIVAEQWVEAHDLHGRNRP
jgi:hydroxymethylglutaryl-CoA reductase